MASYVTDGAQRIVERMTLLQLERRTEPVVLQPTRSARTAGAQTAVATSASRVGAQHVLRSRPSHLQFLANSFSTYPSTKCTRPACAVDSTRFFRLQDHQMRLHVAVLAAGMLLTGTR